jgi:peptidoglycan/LPS O-acetylase OafA/YrhL
VQSATHHGVILFFALSGFLLYLPFAAAALRGQRRPAFRAYLRNRALRILPAYWFILLCTALVLQSARQPGADGVGALTEPGLLLQNMLLIQNYDRDSFASGISPAWSLAVELIFYAALPLLVLVALKLCRRLDSRTQRRWALLAPALILGAIGLGSVALGPHGAGDDTAGSIGFDQLWGVSFFTHAHLFAIGLALAVARAEYEDGLLRLPRRWGPPTAVAMVCLGAIAVQLGMNGVFPETIQVALIAVCCGLLLALTTLGGQPRSGSPLVATLERRPLVAGGLASYSIYLWHLPVILWLRRYGLTLEGGWGALTVNLLTTAAVTGVLSWLTYRHVEKPALRLKASSRRRDGTEVVAGPATSPASDPSTVAVMPRS